MIAPPADPAVRRPTGRSTRGATSSCPAAWTSIPTSPDRKVNAARALRPEERRGAPRLGAARGLPVGDAGQRAEHVRHGLPVRRARLHDGRRCGDSAPRGPACPPRASRHADHRQGDPRPDGEQPRDPGPGPRRRAEARLRETVAWLLERRPAATASRSSIPAASSSGSRGRGSVAALDDAVDHFDVTPRQILTALAHGGRRARPAAPDPPARPEPRPAGQLGDDAGDGCRRSTAIALHLAHIQFHSYGGTAGRDGDFDSRGRARWPIM